MKNLTVLPLYFYRLAADRRSVISCNHSFSLCSLIPQADHYNERFKPAKSKKSKGEMPYATINLSLNIVNIIERP